MNNRILEVIKYKTGGRQVDFCKLLGWTPPYLTKLLRGVSIGISPIIRILQVFPDINARWLLLGEGAMIENNKMANVLHEATIALLELDRYVPVMNQDELKLLESSIALGKLPSFDEDTINNWEAKLKSRDESINSRIAEAQSLSKSNNLCKQRIVKK